MSQIRKLAIEELETAFALILRVFYTYNTKGVNPEDVRFFVEEMMLGKEVQNSFKTQDQEMYGFFLDGKLIGVASLSSNFYIMFMFVDDQYHHQGIARTLFEYLLLVAKQRQAKAIWLDASQYAIGFYKRLGFTQSASNRIVSGLEVTPMVYQIELKG